MSIFGNLFDEIEEEECGKAPSATKTGIELPPSSRLPSGLCGIANQGATCYLNSLLQTLLYTAELRESLFSLRSDELGCSENGYRERNGQVRIIPLELQRLFARLLLCNQQAISTAALTDSFGWNNEEERQQHDVQELNRILFGAIEDSLVGTTGQYLISSLYHGTIVNQITCSQCSRVSEKEEDFLDISVAVPGNGSLENGLFNTFCKDESLVDKNRYHCEQCQKLVNATRIVRIHTLPQILTVSLLRFSFDFNKMQRYKDTNKLTFPHRIDMSLYLEKQAEPGMSVYELFSVVNHKGGAYGGHYHAYIRDVDQLGTWTSPDEEEPLQHVTIPARTEINDWGSPEKLVYTLLSPAGFAGLSVDKLCSGMVQYAGLSWNKRFRKKYGPIFKFLKSHSDKFRIDEKSNTVFLSRGHLSDGLNDARASTAANPVHTAKIRASVSDTSANTRNKRSQSPVPEPGYCWFNFNDSLVHPIRTKDIEKTFSGKESAYMLFYRRTSLPRQQSGMNEAQNHIPPHLVTSVLQENEEVDKLREQYESRINEVHMEVHFSDNYIFTDGALRQGNPDTSPYKMMLDRRKPVTELLDEIGQLPVFTIGAEFLVHRLREVPAGYHLYDCISAKSTCTLDDALICNGSKLFVWDGQRVRGTLISTGEDCEPINMTVIWGNNDTLTQGFPKCLTLGELKVSISELVQIATCDLKLTHIPVGASSEVVQPLISANYGYSLSELKLENGCCILAESRSNHIGLDCEQTFQQDKPTPAITKIKIENRCVQETQDDYPLLEVPAEKYTSVGELKALALSLMTDWPAECRLRLCHDSLGLCPPLCENQTLEDAGVTADKLLVLELGPVPDTDQLTLAFTLPNSLMRHGGLELMVKRQSTVASCLTQVLQAIAMIDETWHLRKTNWCQEPGDVLDDPDATLDDAGIHTGDFLLLEKGKLPRKGFVHVSVLLFPVDKTVTRLSSGLISWVTDSIQGLLLSASNSDCSIEKSSSSADPVDLGIIEFSKTATLAELKSHLLKLPGWKINDLTAPSSIDVLRVRHVRNGRLSTVFRDLKQTLQRLKVTTSSTIGIQLLQHNEQLGPNQVVLKVCQRVPDTRRYSAAVEFVCTLSPGRTVAELKQEMGLQVCACPPERLLLAKHWPQKFEWTILKDEKTKVKVNNQKSKKTGRVPLVDLKGAPYYLADGDLIGVTDVLFTKGPLNDFSTDDDIAGLAELQRLAEEKRDSHKEKQACASVMDSQIKPRRPEVPLTIKVDRFS